MQSRIRCDRSRSSSGSRSSFVASARLGLGPEERLVRPIRRQALAEAPTAPSAELRRVHVALDAEYGRPLRGYGGVDGGPVERWAAGRDRRIGGWGCESGRLADGIHGH